MCKKKKKLCRFYEKKYFVIDQIRFILDLDQSWGINLLMEQDNELLGQNQSYWQQMLTIDIKP